LIYSAGLPQGKVIDLLIYSAGLPQGKVIDLFIRFTARESYRFIYQVYCKGKL
jgi:hypothetical protein